MLRRRRVKPPLELISVRLRRASCFCPARLDVIPAIVQAERAGEAEGVRMEARRAETSAFTPRLGLRQPTLEGARPVIVISTHALGACVPSLNDENFLASSLLLIEPSANTGITRTVSRCGPIYSEERS
ncbi:hypothetical protein IV02_08255 [Pseudomonas syringae]|uniref:Uncharacterized protein n=1 Tax=Pseudomonas syringae TaxID=317 RepID=A0A085VAF2_PSESX|nr:hypothetical protein IV02_08255 [Pseudomonas syringae]